MMSNPHRKRVSAQSKVRAKGSGCNAEKQCPTMKILRTAMVVALVAFGSSFLLPAPSAAAPLSSKQLQVLEHTLQNTQGVRLTVGSSFDIVRIEPVTYRPNQFVVDLATPNRSIGLRALVDLSSGAVLESRQLDPAHILFTTADVAAAFALVRNLPSVRARLGATLALYRASDSLSTANVPSRRTGRAQHGAPRSLRSASLYRTALPCAARLCCRPPRSRRLECRATSRRSRGGTSKYHAPASAAAARFPNTIGQQSANCVHAAARLPRNKVCFRLGLLECLLALRHGAWFGGRSGQLQAPGRGSSIDRHRRRARRRDLCPICDRRSALL